MKAGLSEPATMEEVLDMAGFLEIDPEAEPRLMWIAKQACLAPLPEGWAELEDPAGQAYYYHAATDRSTRAHPLDATFQVLLKMERARLGKWSFSRAANIGLAEDEAPMRLLEADGSALYTYDWCKKTRGEEVSIPPILAEAAPAAAPAAVGETEATPDVQALKDEGIIEEKEAPPPPPSVASTLEGRLNRMPLSSRKTGGRGRGGLSRATTSGIIRSSSRSTTSAYLYYVNPLTYLVFLMGLLHAVSHKLKLKGGGIRAQK